MFARQKRDGHTHTHYCLHASGEQAEEYVLAAIAQGFTVYSFTEHLPLAADFLQKFPYAEEVKETLGFWQNDLDGYFREMLALQKKYRDRIQLLVGWEVDYLESEHEYLKMMFREYGPFLEDGLLSVHMLPGHGGWRCLDLSPLDLQEGLIAYYGSYEQMQLAYYQTVKKAVRANLGPYKPKRISHLTLCNKFQHYFPQAGLVSAAIKNTVYDLLRIMREQGYSLDLNMSGLFREYCQEPYPAPWIVQMARQLGIPLVYGSDAHKVADVGRAYAQYQQLVKP